MSEIPPPPPQNEEIITPSPLCKPKMGGDKKRNFRGKDVDMSITQDEDVANFIDEQAKRELEEEKDIELKQLERDTQEAVEKAKTKPPRKHKPKVEITEERKAELAEIRRQNLAKARIKRDANRAEKRQLKEKVKSDDEIEYEKQIIKKAILMRKKHLKNADDEASQKEPKRREKIMNEVRHQPPPLPEPMSPPKPKFIFH